MLWGIAKWTYAGYPDTKYQTLFADSVVVETAMEEGKCQ